MASTLCSTPVVLLVLLVSLGKCQGQAFCKVKPFKYSYKSTTTDAVQTGCSMSATRPSYVHCTGNALPLSDGDLGPNCDITDQQGRFYIWERSPETTHSLLLSFSQTISPTHIRLHYFSDPANGIGVPTLQLYADIENPWDTPTRTDVRIANVRAMLKDESEPPRREIHNITLNSASPQLATLFLRIRFTAGSTVSSFYLSEVEVFTEVFTCSPENPESPINCDTTSSLSSVVTSTTSYVHAHVPTPTSSPTRTPTTSEYSLAPTESAVPKIVTPAPETSECSCHTELAWTLVYVFATLFIALLCMVIAYCGWVQAKACWRQKQKVQIQQEPPTPESEESKLKSCTSEQPQVHHEYAVLTYFPPTPELNRRDPNQPEVYSEPHIYESLSPYHSNNQVSQL